MTRLSKKIASRVALRNTIKTAKTLQAIFGGRRQKKAFSQREIDMAVANELRREGVHNILADHGLTVPDIAWGEIFYKAIHSVGRRMRWDRQQREDFLSDVVGDILMGRDIGSLDANPWKHNLATQIMEWVLDGWPKARIEATLTRWIQHKALNIFSRWQTSERPLDVGFSPGRPPSELGPTRSGEVFEGLLNLDSLSSSQLAGYHSILRENRVARNMVNMIGQMLNKRNDAQGLIWQAYSKDPSATVRELLETPVLPEGSFSEMPLWQAMGWKEGASSNPGKLHYQIKKLRDELMKKWPEIKSVLNEIDQDRGHGFA